MHVLRRRSQVLKMSMFSLYFTKSSRLDEFEQSQMQTIDQIGNYLKDTWSVTLKNTVKSSFKDVGKVQRLHASTKGCSHCVHV